MRKIVLALLVLLLAVPAMATVEVSCAQVSTESGEVIVTYDVDDGNDFRAFGIKISVDNGATISGIDVNDDDYWVFPGSIDINEAGEVNDVGSAIAAQDSNSFILEMGSLYKVGSDEDHNTVPPTSGQLCSFMVSGDCNVAIDNDAPRGGVVMEDIDKTFGPSYVTLVGVNVTIIPCYDGQDDFAEWDTVGRPDSWCIPRQCHGDADGIDNPYGDPRSGLTAWVADEDFIVLMSGYHVTYNGDPCTQPWIAADFDHTNNPYGDPRSGLSARVCDEDFIILMNHYHVPVDPNCLD